MQCLLCDLQSAQLICDACYLTLPFHQTGCLSCGLKIIPGNDRGICSHCLSEPPAFDYVHALFDYATPISSLITQLKFQGNLTIAKLFAHYWIGYLKNNRSTLPECIIPTPLHYKRLQERGFNQALEIAKPIGKFFNIPIDIRSCIKLKNTQPQSSLSADKRRKNLKNAFALSHSIEAKHVVILDDVMTTGNTISEISILLKKSGVEQVGVWCCARA
jgi:ComF family protein